ncbi:MAG TPA: ROK family transcriptional regulator [Candidatus Avibacteroides faecavium]|nr:ROK family transcriptional regulator [Candidatus Avibacteroides faecavium]
MKKDLMEEIESGTKNALIKKRIINHYIYHGNSTITDLSRAVDLSVPTVTKFLVEMCKNGYINDYGKLETNGGRHPNLYGLTPDSAYFVGVDLQAEAVVLGMMNFKGDMMQTKTITPFNLKNDDECIDKICSYVKGFIEESGLPKEKIINVNINIPSRVNPHTGHSFGFFNYIEKPLNAMFAERLGYRVSIDNDTRAMAYGEYMKGCVENEKNIIFVNISWGLSISIIIDGKMYYGKSGFAGEFGHIPAFDNEVLCYCGKKGCMETEVSGSALYRKLIQKVKEGETSILSQRIMNNEELTLHDIINATNREDTLCIDLVEGVGRELGRHISTLINIFNPELVVIGGTLAQTEDYLIQPIEASVRKYSLSLVNKDSKIKRSALLENAGIVGACMLARSKMFEVDD